VSSQQINDIEAEISRLEVLCKDCLAKRHYQQYNHFRTRIQDLEKTVAALKDLDDRIGT